MLANLMPDTATTIAATDSIYQDMETTVSMQCSRITQELFPAVLHMTPCIMGSKLAYGVFPQVLNPKEVWRSLDLRLKCDMDEFVDADPPVPAPVSDSSESKPNYYLLWEQPNPTRDHIIERPRTGTIVSLQWSLWYYNGWIYQVLYDRQRLTAWKQRPDARAIHPNDAMNMLYEFYWYSSADAEESLVPLWRHNHYSDLSL